MRKFNVVFGEVIQDSYRSIPQLPISIVDEQETEISVGYLTPFRRYCFQVSGDTCGNADYGSSNVLNLMALYPLEENMRKEMLKGQIAIAIETFLTRSYVEFPCRRISENGEYTITKTDAGNRIVLTLNSGTKLNGVAHSLKVTITEESTTVILDRYKLDGVKL